MITEKSIDEMIANVAKIAATAAIAMERGLPTNRIMAHLEKGGNTVPKLIMDAVLNARNEFDSAAKM